MSDDRGIATEGSREGNARERDSRGGDARQVLVDVAIDSWKLARLFGRLLTKLDAGEAPRFANQLRYYLKRLEERLQDAESNAPGSINERPPARCSTFASADFNRVPLPAPRITMTKSEFAIPTLSAVHADLTTKGGALRCEWDTSVAHFIETVILTYPIRGVLCLRTRLLREVMP